MRNIRTLALAFASSAMLLATACSNNENATKDDPAAKTEVPADTGSDVTATPTATAPSDAPSGAAPADKAPAAK